MRHFQWLLLVLALLLPKPMLAFCEVPNPRLVCAEYFASTLVVEAALVQTTGLHDKDDPDGISAYVYTLRVSQTLRGNAVKTLTVYEGNDSGRATFDWIKGTNYLLFLNHTTDKRSWELDGCGNSGPLSKAAAALSEIDAIKVAHGNGVIHGVVSEQDLVTPVAGVNINVRGAGRQFTATTNAKGEFQVNAPPGRYIVHAAQSGRSFDKADFSYEDPGNIRIQTGGCAQVQFVRAQR
jgi:hypothetical protein